MLGDLLETVCEAPIEHALDNVAVASRHGGPGSVAR